MAPVVGREQELRTLHDFVDGRSEPGTQVLLVEGEAGMGRSLLWRSGVDRARRTGTRVLTARPAEAESALANAGLGDLLDDVVDEVAPILSAPRLRALHVALLREDAGDEPIDPRALGLATRDALTALATDGPLLLAVDDVHWLDAPSAQALAFALRRLRGDVRVLLTWRPGHPTTAPALTEALAGSAVRRVVLPPLDVTDLHRLLQEVVSKPIARQTLLAIHHTSGGNPARALAQAQDVATGRRQASWAGGVAGVMPPGDDDPPSATTPRDPLLQAHDLARTLDSPDTRQAAVLEDAVAQALDRRALPLAAVLAEHAVRLTPAEQADQRHRRLLLAARAHRDAGEWTRAAELAEQVRRDADAGVTRAGALVLLAELGSADQAVELLEAALGDPAMDPAWRCDVQGRLAWASRFRDGYATAFQHSRTAVQLAASADDPALRRRSALVNAILGWTVGEAAAPETVDLRDLAEALGGERLVQEALLALVHTHAAAPGRDRLRRVLMDELHRWRERDEPLAAHAMWGLSWVELHAGNWTEALTHATAARDTATQYGVEVPQDHLPLALLRLHRGEVEAARRHSHVALEMAQAQFGLRPPQHLAILGLVAYGGDEPDMALALLGQAEQQAQDLGWREPALRWWTAAHVELLLQANRTAEALALLDGWDQQVRRVGRPWCAAHVARCRGLVAAAQGETDHALRLLERAVADHTAVGDPFGRAQALLALGAVRRRARMKRAARDALTDAAEGFQRLGAVRWAQRAEAEAGRIGGRTRQHALTEAEMAVAVLVAQGRTNREVAATLFLAERTVSSHLTRIYAKLGVRSRTELAGRPDLAGPTHVP